MGTGAGDDSASEIEVVTELLDFSVDGKRCAIGGDDGSVVLLLSIKGVAPLPVENRVGAMVDQANSPIRTTFR